MIQYRNMIFSDYDQVIGLWQSCEGLNMREADSPAGIHSYLERNPGFSFVAENENGIVATLMAGHDGKRGYIQHLAVADAERGKGMARELLRRCLDALKDEGILKSHVHVKADNPAGLGFWSRMGWLERDEIVMYSFINGDNSNV